MAGSEPCDLLQVEGELDMLEAELAVELPPHMRAFARAHAQGRPPPPAPALLHRPRTLQAARAACMHDVIADRGLALLRLVVPLVIESDPAVTAARAEPATWQGLQTLTTARNAVALARFGRSAIELLAALHGTVATPAQRAAPGPAIEGWHERAASVGDAGIRDAWQRVATRLGVAGSPQVHRGTSGARVQPRTFVVEPRREVIVVVSHVLDTPATRFAVLHELGHAVVALAMRPGIPRVVDEAAASYVARLMESPDLGPSGLPPRWSSELAIAARRRRLAIAMTLDAIERALPVLPTELPAATPPWALWFDPGAQAAYVAAEALADVVVTELGTNPAPGDVIAALAAERDRIDQRTQLQA